MRQKNGMRLKRKSEETKNVTERGLFKRSSEKNNGKKTSKHKKEMEKMSK